MPPRKKKPAAKKDPPASAEKPQKWQPGDDLFANLTDGQSLFLRAFLDAGNIETFMRPYCAAVAAGVRQDHAGYLMQALEPRIQWFLHEIGLSESALKSKVVELMNARETKVVPMKGFVEEWETQPNTKILARSTQKDKDGVEQHTTIMGLDMEAKELQRRALDMALKLRELYPAERREITGKGGGPIEHRDDLSLLTDTERAARIDALLERARRERARAVTDGGSE
ncbi:MAG: hypothetical protein ACYS7Y_34460 [Planctomycetota bacterium]|jgi:hypothetical protein